MPVARVGGTAGALPHDFHRLGLRAWPECFLCSQQLPEPRGKTPVSAPELEGRSDGACQGQKCTSHHNTFPSLRFCPVSPHQTARASGQESWGTQELGFQTSAPCLDSVSSYGGAHVLVDTGVHVCACVCVVIRRAGAGG